MLQSHERCRWGSLCLYDAVKRSGEDSPQVTRRVTRTEGVTKSEQPLLCDAASPAGGYLPVGSLVHANTGLLSTELLVTNEISAHSVGTIKKPDLGLRETAKSTSSNVMHMPKQTCQK